MYENLAIEELRGMGYVVRPITDGDRHMRDLAEKFSPEKTLGILPNGFEIPVELITFSDADACGEGYEPGEIALVIFMDQVIECPSSKKWWQALSEVHYHGSRREYLLN